MIEALRNAAHGPLAAVAQDRLGARTGTASVKRPALPDVLKAGIAGAVCSALPSTAYTLARGESPLDGARAAGAIVLPSEERTPALLLAAAPVHLGLSLGWACVLAALPRRGPGWGALAGLGIAALDLGVIGRRIPAIRALPQGRQWADHAAYGIAVGWMLSRR